MRSQAKREIKSLRHDLTEAIDSFQTISNLISGTGVMLAVGACVAGVLNLVKESGSAEAGDIASLAIFTGIIILGPTLLFVWLQRLAFRVVILWLRSMRAMLPPTEPEPDAPRLEPPQRQR